MAWKEKEKIEKRNEQKLTRQQLRELEEAEKSTLQIWLDRRMNIELSQIDTIK